MVVLNHTLNPKALKSKWCNNKYDLGLISFILLNCIATSSKFTKAIFLYDPNIGKGRELFGYLQSVNESGADLKIVGKEIVVHLVFIFFKFFFEAGDVAG